jgi:ABC-type taurine transport system ATPase subunit
VDKCLECKGKGWTGYRPRSDWVNVCNSCAGSGSTDLLDVIKGIAQLAGLSLRQAESLMIGPGRRRGLNFSTAERALQRLQRHLDHRA